MGHILFNGMSFHWSTQSLQRHSSFQKSTGACGVFLVPSSFSSMMAHIKTRHTGDTQAEWSWVCSTWRRRGQQQFSASTIYFWLQGMQREHHLHEEKLWLVIRKKKSQWEGAALKKLLSNLCPWRFSEWSWKKPFSDLEITCCEKEHGQYCLKGPFKPKLFFHSNYWLQISLLLHLPTCSSGAKIFLPLITDWPSNMAGVL